jgi:glycosyltransferase involved in cell wall biosynthesis
MKLLFIHDTPFFEDAGLYYTTSGLIASVWCNNYLPYFDYITVIGRHSFSEKFKNQLSSTEDSRVQFSLIDEYTSILQFFRNYAVICQKIESEIERNDFTILRLPCQFGFAALNLLIKKHKPFLIEVVENTFEAYWYYPSIAGKICANYFHHKLKIGLKHAPFAVYVAERLRKIYPTQGQSAILSNVILENILRPNEIQISRFYGEKLKVGLVGALDVKYKGQAVLLKAVSSLDDTIKRNIEFYFVGSGKYEWIIQLAKKLHLNTNIQFIGQLPHADVLCLLETLSLYIHPSFKEGLPRAMLEAMSVGCPVLGSTNGGIPEVVKLEYLHKPGDYKKLSKQIKLFYENRKLLEKEAFCNLELVKPFLKENLNKRRKEFYTNITQILAK